jgi:hypothetical protein
MELFPASSQKQFSFIKRVIERCDYYVVIVGGRYGSLADGDISYTEMEYDYAGAKGISCLAFLHADPQKIALGKSDQEKKKIQKLQKFRKKLQDSALVDFWTSADELATKVVLALGQEVTINPGVGWVRGDNAADPAIYKELEEGRKKVRELELALSAYDGDRISFPSDLADIEEQFEITIQFTELNYSSEKKNYTGGKKHTLTKDLSWNDIFIMAGVTMYYNDDEESIVKNLCKFVVSNSSKKFEKHNTFRIDNGPNHQVLRIQFEALGLISAKRSIREERSHSSYDFMMTRDNKPTVKVPYISWEFTEKGRNFLARSLAKKRAAP